MPLSPTDLVLHHHDASYNSHKARAFLGIKRATWHSVIQPLISPKPTFTRLTGAYQRVPVLQVGADLYCDSRLVVAEIERRVPDPPAWGPLDGVVQAWVDKVLTPATFAVAIPDMAPAMTPAFVQDRADIYGPSFDLDGIAGASPLMHEQWRAQVVWLEQALEVGGGPFLTGERPTAADALAYVPLWMFLVREEMASWLGRPEDLPDVPATVPDDPDPADHTERLLAGFDRVRAWRTRMAAFGEGDRRPATPEDGFALAAACSPAGTVVHDTDDPSGLTPGTAVTAIADDSTRDPVPGTLVAATPEQIVLAREEPELGTLHVHLPRFAYFLSAA